MADENALTASFIKLAANENEEKKKLNLIMPEYKKQALNFSKFNKL